MYLITREVGLLVQFLYLFRHGQRSFTCLLGSDKVRNFRSSKKLIKIWNNP